MTDLETTAAEQLSTRAAKSLDALRTANVVGAARGGEARTGTSTHAISALTPAASLGNRAAWPAETTTRRDAFSRYQHRRLREWRPPGKEEP